MFRQWTYIVPEGGSVSGEMQDGNFVVWCDGPEEPIPQPLPPGSGVNEWVIGVHHFKLEWEYADGELVIVDFDEWVSIDEEMG